METDVKLTKLAKCAGCGAKVGAGTLARLLTGFKTHFDERLIVGYDKSDDASVFVINKETAIVQTVDFFPPIVDDPFLFGQIAAANAISDIYAMGAVPKLALNVMCVPESLDKSVVQEILRGGYSKAYEAGIIITGGHTIHVAEPVYGLAVSGFVHPDKVLTNGGALPGDVLILTKRLGTGIIMTAGKAEFAEAEIVSRAVQQMTELNKTACEIMVNYNVHSCTDVTGFGLLGHSCEMAEASKVSLEIDIKNVPLFAEALEFADMGMIPAGAYRNRDYVADRIKIEGEISRAQEDVLYDPQTSGGLLIALPEKEAEACLQEMKKYIPAAAIIGKVTEQREMALYLQ